MLLGALVVSSVASADINTGLVAHWSFDDCTAKDISGHGYDGTINGNSQCVDGMLAKAMFLNGSTDYIDIFDQYFKSITVSAWILPNNITQSSSIVDGWKNAENFILGITPDFKVTASFHKRKDLKNIYPEVHVSSNKPLSRSVYSHLVMTFSGSLLKLYINGVKVAESTVSGEPYLVPTQTNPDNSIGLNRDGNTFLGVIDSVRLYNRALSSTEIQQLYRIGQPVSGKNIGFNQFNVTCENLTTGVTISIPAATTVWDCEAQGLVINPNDQIRVITEGKAH